MQPGKFIERVLFLLALSSISSLALITIFIFLEGGPLIYFAGLKNFLASSHWAPTKGHFGILAMIVSSLLVTLGAMVIGMPLGLSCAIVLAEFSPTRLKLVLKPTLELLAGIPSVVYGFLGVVWLVPADPRLPGRARAIAPGRGHHPRHHDPAHHHQHLH